jgi:hypothetical protein
LYWLCTGFALASHLLRTGFALHSHWLRTDLAGWLVWSLLTFAFPVLLVTQQSTNQFDVRPGIHILFFMQLLMCAISSVVDIF